MKKRVASVACGIFLSGFVSAQNPGKELTDRLMELKDDASVSATTRGDAKKLLAQLARNDARIRWDGPPGGGLTTTADCPGRPKSEFKKGWGSRQLLAISRNWCEVYENWKTGNQVGPQTLGAANKLDVLIGSMFHELYHIEDGPYDWPPANKKDEGKIEAPAYCRQIDFYDDILFQPPYSYETGGRTPRGLALAAYIRAKRAQKEEWVRHKNS